MFKKTKKQDGTSLKRIMQNIAFMLKYCFKAAPFFTIYKLLNHARNRFVVFLEHTWLLGYIIDAVNEQKPFSEVATVIIGIFALSFLLGLFGNYVDIFAYPRCYTKIKNSLLNDLYKKASEIDLACYDNPTFYDDYVWAVSNAPDRVMRVLSLVDAVIGSVVAVILAVSYILQQDAVGIVVIVVSFFAIFYMTRLSQKIWFKQEERTRPISRKLDYISRLFYLNDHSKEIRLGDIVANLFDEYHDAAERLSEERKKDNRKIVLLNILGGFVFNTFLVDGVYLLYLMFKAIVKKTLSYGNLVVMYKACNYVKGAFWTLAHDFPQLQEQSMYTEKIRYFLDYEVKIKDPADPKEISANGGDIELKNVSFAYGDTPVLKNINMTIKRGERIALVGYNGAGKTTLIKLIMRLYDPTEGEICYSGENIKDFRVSEYRKSFETVFQDFQLFAASVGENLVLDDKEFDRNRADRAVKLSGFAEKLKDLPNGYDTQVTREFDDNGVLLSGGEEQKLAIARALYKDSPVIILDEPSSALDPLAEYELNRTMLTLQENKTVITISHRLSTTRMADKIYMLENGEIVECGTHEELMAINGKYAEMFTLQAKKYAGEDE